VLSIDPNCGIVGAHYLWVGCIHGLVPKVQLDIYQTHHTAAFPRAVVRTNVANKMLEASKKLEFLDNIYCRPYMKTGIPSLNIPKTDPMDIDRFAKTPLFCRNNHSHCTDY